MHDAVLSPQNSLVIGIISLGDMLRNWASQWHAEPKCATSKVFTGDWPTLAFGRLGKIQLHSTTRRAEAFRSKRSLLARQHPNHLSAEAETSVGSAMDEIEGLQEVLAGLFRPSNALATRA